MFNSVSIDLPSIVNMRENYFLFTLGNYLFVNFDGSVKL